MNKLIFAFIFIILLINAYASNGESECQQKKINEDSTTIPNSTNLTEDDCKGLKTHNDTLYKCSLNSDKKSCGEVEKSECEKKTKTEISRRMLSSTNLTEDDCKGLKTHNDTLYKCSLNSDKNSCVEVEKSECDKKTKAKTSRRMLSSAELTENECKNMKTSNDTEYICTVSSDKKSCEETSKPPSECYKQKSSSTLSPELIEEDCEDLNTSDNTKYICALRIDELSCFEKVNSNYLKLAITLFLCLFLFI